MNKREFFLASMGAGNYKRKNWVISAFALVNESPDEYKRDHYPYRIIQTPAGYFFIDPNNGNDLTRIDDAKSGEPLFGIKETLQITSKDNIPNFTGSTLETTYGRLLFNYVAVIYPFGSKIPYQNERTSPSKMEDLIIVRLKDIPEKEEDRTQEDIYVDEYLQFCDAMFYLTGFTQLCVPTLSEKAITPAPGIAELKEKLLAENKDRLNDPAVIAKIDAELVAYDKAYLKGDVSEGFLITKKSTEIVRKKLFGMHGAETGFGSGVEVDLIKNSLYQGWDIEKFPAMMNNLRVGSYSRGAETMLGGESVKWLLRTSSNMAITVDDCGTKLGNTVHITDSNYKRLIGFGVIQAGKTVLVPDEATAKEYIGRTVMQRSPMFCQAEKTDFCKACCGPRLAESPTALSAAVSDYGSTMMYISMQAMKGKALQTAKMSFKEAIF